jgi:hypothetical protein
MDIGRERQGKPPETDGDAAIRQPNEGPTDRLRQPIAADSVIQQTLRRLGLRLTWGDHGSAELDVCGHRQNQSHNRKDYNALAFCRRFTRIQQSTPTHRL